jgi:hypothetical protein
MQVKDERLTHNFNKDKSKVKGKFVKGEVREIHLKVLYMKSSFVIGRRI